MNSEKWTVTTTEELIAATKNASVRKIAIRGRLLNAPSVRLMPGQELCGGSDQAEILFEAGVDGLQLTSDNQVGCIQLRASPDKRAIFNDTSVAGLGYMSLAGITVNGQVQILSRDSIRSGHVEVDGLDIISADVRPGVSGRKVMASA